ncbi:MAG: class I SAM-dependent methyltransferase [Candidatus Marinimicrobia bacterium]|nr:class I SAM-dependent methyltransferase [Candidatus Neomarinimicrobiota bacterium]
MFKPLINKADFDSWAEYYWTYQFTLADRYLIPYLRNYIPSFDGLKILDVGCGEGGTAAAFARIGAECYGTDIDEYRLQKSSEIPQNNGIHFELLDVYDINSSDTISNTKFDLIILRDVIEHLTDTFEALRAVKEILAEDGKIFLTFPPYNSVFGGHQQIIAPIPFIHLMPSFLFYNILKMFGGDKGKLSKLRHIRQVRMSISRILKTVKLLDFLILDNTSYIMRPSFKVRYGLPIIKSNFIGSIPLIREFKISGFFLLITPDRER